MPKIRTGYVYQDKAGRWFARFDFTDAFGKRRVVRRRAESKTKAKELLDKLLRDYKERGQQAIDGDRLTFNALADYYEQHFLTEPQYVDGRKVAGLRSAYDLKFRLATLRGYFGKRLVKAITHDAIEQYRAARLKTPTIHERQRSIATVNRELSLLRRVFNIAVRNGWLLKNPLAANSSLITPGDEKPRERILTRDEETRLLAVCSGLLRAVVVTALDTGMRRGELLTLRWTDVDFATGVITVRAFNTKTMRERQIAMTVRVLNELAKLHEQAAKAPDNLVFGVTGNLVKKAFVRARRKAGLDDVHFHDLRHTAATRLVQSGMALPEVGRILGHTQANTTYRYVNANADTARRAADLLNQFNATSEAAQDDTTLIQ